MRVALVLALLLILGCSENRGADASADQPGPAAEHAGQAAAFKEITLAVDGMDCPMCPVTVRRALNRVEGVVEAEADLKTGEARVRFDPALTDIDELIAAVRDSGFSAATGE